MSQSKMNNATNTNQANNSNSIQEAKGKMCYDVEKRPVSLSSQLNFDDDIQPAGQPAIPRSQPISAEGGPSGISLVPTATSPANYNGINNKGVNG